MREREREGGREKERKRDKEREREIERVREREKEFERERGIFGSKWLRDFLLWGPINVRTRRKGAKKLWCKHILTLL